MYFFWEVEHKYNDHKHIGRGLLIAKTRAEAKKFIKGMIHHIIDLSLVEITWTEFEDMKMMGHKLLNPN
jgi:hypothetical protein